MDYVITPEIMAESQAALDRNLRAPADSNENITFKAGAEPGLGTWTEAMIIKDTSWAPPKNPKPGVNAMVAQVVLEVLGPGDGGFVTNAGSNHYHVAYLDMDALKDTKNRMHGLNMRRIGVLTQLFTTCGLDAAHLSLKDALNEDSTGLKPLINQRVGAVVRKYKYTKDKGKPTQEIVTACEIDSFLQLP